MIDELALVLGNYLIFAQFCICLIFFVSKGRQIIGKFLVCLGLAWAVSRGIKDLFYYPRPYIVHTLQPVGKYLLDGSFPSEHALVSATLSALVYKIDPKFGTLMWITTFLISLGRMLLGVHTFLDVAGGVILGFLIVKLVDNYHSK